MRVHEPPSAHADMRAFSFWTEDAIACLSDTVRHRNTASPNICGAQTSRVPFSHFGSVPRGRDRGADGRAIAIRVYPIESF